MTLSETELAYAAGFIDGEGCFHIHQKFPEKGNGISMTHVPTLTVGQKRPETIYWFKEKFGGSVYLRTMNGSPFYSWRIANRQLTSFLPMVMPYLRDKLDQAEIAFELANRKKNIGRGILTVEEVAYRESLRDSIHDAKLISRT